MEEKRVNMGRERFTAEQIIGQLREAEVLLGHGSSIGDPGPSLASVTRPITFSGRSTAAWGWTGPGD